MADIGSHALRLGWAVLKQGVLGDASALSEWSHSFREQQWSNPGGADTHYDDEMAKRLSNLSEIEAIGAGFVVPTITPEASSSLSRLASSVNLISKNERIITPANSGIMSSLVIVDMTTIPSNSANFGISLARNFTTIKTRVELLGTELYKKIDQLQSLEAAISAKQQRISDAHIDFSKSLTSTIDQQLATFASQMSSLQDTINARHRQTQQDLAKLNMARLGGNGNFSHGHHGQQHQHGGHLDVPKWILNTKDPGGGLLGRMGLADVPKAGGAVSSILEEAGLIGLVRTVVMNPYVLTALGGAAAIGLYESGIVEKLWDKYGHSMMSGLVQFIKDDFSGKHDQMIQGGLDWIEKTGSSFLRNHPFISSTMGYMAGGIGGAAITSEIALMAQQSDPKMHAAAIAEMNKHNTARRKGPVADPSGFSFDMQKQFGNYSFDPVKWFHSPSAPSAPRGHFNPRGSPIAVVPKVATPTTPPATIATPQGVPLEFTAQEHFMNWIEGFSPWDRDKDPRLGVTPHSIGAGRFNIPGQTHMALPGFQMADTSRGRRLSMYSNDNRVTAGSIDQGNDNLHRPTHIGGKLSYDGKNYSFGSGGLRGKIDQSIPYGDYPIGGPVGSWGQAHGAIGINSGTIHDPMLNRDRLGIELHGWNDAKLLSEGCVAIAGKQWPELQASIQARLANGEKLYLHVHGNSASIDTNPPGAGEKTLSPQMMSQQVQKINPQAKNAGEATERMAEGVKAGRSVEEIKNTIQSKINISGSECVDLVKAYTGSKGFHTTSWYKNNKVTAENAPPGSALATFLSKKGVASDVYAGGTGGRGGVNLDHAVIKLGNVYDKQGNFAGMRVMDQWRGSGGPHERVIGMGEPGTEKSAREYYGINVNGKLLQRNDGGGTPTTTSGQKVILFAHGMLDRYGNTKPEEVEAAAQKIAAAQGARLEVIRDKNGRPISGAGTSAGSQLLGAIENRIKQGNVYGIIGFSAGANAIANLPPNLKSGLQYVNAIGGDVSLNQGQFQQAKVEQTPKIAGVPHMGLVQHIASTMSPVGTPDATRVSNIRDQQFTAPTGKVFKIGDTVTPGEYFGEEAAAKLPGGMRASNNPGNLKYSGSKWQLANLSKYGPGGQLTPSSQRDEGTQQLMFANPVAGMAGTAVLALTKYRSGMTTPNEIMRGPRGWTPGSVGAGSDNVVANAMGIGVNDDLQLDKPERMEKFLQGLILREHGPKGKQYYNLIKPAVADVLGTSGTGTETQRHTIHPSGYYHHFAELHTEHIAAGRGPTLAAAAAQTQVHIRHDRDFYNRYTGMRAPQTVGPSGGIVGGFGVPTPPHIDRSPQHVGAAGGIVGGARPPIPSAVRTPQRVGAAGGIIGGQQPAHLLPPTKKGMQYLMPHSMGGTAGKENNKTMKEMHGMKPGNTPRQQADNSAADIKNPRSDMADTSPGGAGEDGTGALDSICFV